MIVIGWIIASVIYVYNVFVFKTLFNWFLPAQFNTPEIGWAMAFGLMSLIGLATYTHVPREPEDAVDFLKMSVITPTIALIVGLFAYASI